MILLGLALAASFEVSMSDCPGGAKEAFEYAAQRWSRLIASEVPIRVQVSFVTLHAKAVTVPNGAVDFEGAWFRSTWYPAALADAISGRDQNPDQVDMEIFFDASADWYFGVDGDVPADRVDFVTVAMHEIAHGLGMTSLLRRDGDTAHYGLRSDRAPPEVSFPMPDIAGRPTILDRFIETSRGERVSGVVLAGGSPGDSALLFGGAASTRANGGSGPRLNGRDTSHLDRSLYEGTINSLMSPTRSPGRAMHEPGPVLLGILEDIGWTVRLGP